MIVVFGSVNLDLVTPVARIAGPGETVLGASYTRIPGGKGANQALAARRAGAKVALVGATGLDAFADTALSLLSADGVDLTGIAKVDLPTGAAFISVDREGQNAITVAAGANSRASARQVERLPLGPKDILLLQREVPDAEGEAAAKHARTQGARVILNLAPAGPIAPGYLASLDIVVMNEHEAAELGGLLGTGPDHDALAETLWTRFRTGSVVTLGAGGALGWHAGETHRVAAPKIEVVDTTAAGDTFVGAFAAALDGGRTFVDALARGTSAGSLACTRAGAQPSIPTAAEVDRVLALGPDR